VRVLLRGVEIPDSSGGRPSRNRRLTRWASSWVGVPRPALPGGVRGEKAGGERPRTRCGGHVELTV